jgi:hypothetical protein
VVRRERRELATAIDALQPRGAPRELGVERLGAGTVGDQIRRYRQLADAGVQTAIVALPDAATPGALESFGEVIAGFPRPARPW